MLRKERQSSCGVDSWAEDGKWNSGVDLRWDESLFLRFFPHCPVKLCQPSVPFFYSLLPNWVRIQLCFTRFRNANMGSETGRILGNKMFSFGHVFIRRLEVKSLSASTIWRRSVEDYSYVSFSPQKYDPGFIVNPPPLNQSCHFLDKRHTWTSYPCFSEA